MLDDDSPAAIPLGTVKADRTQIAVRPPKQPARPKLSLPDWCLQLTDVIQPYMRICELAVWSRFTNIYRQWQLARRPTPFIRLYGLMELMTRGFPSRAIGSSQIESKH